MRDILREEHLEKIRKNAESELYKECTFQPKINKYEGFISKTRSYSKPTKASQNKILNATSLSPIEEKPKIQTKNIKVGSQSLPHHIEDRLIRRASCIVSQTSPLNFDHSFKHSSTNKVQSRLNIDTGLEKFIQTYRQSEVFDQSSKIRRYLTTSEVTITEIVDPILSESFGSDE